MAFPRQNYDELVQFRAPDGFSLAVSTAARRDYQTTSEFLRRCAISRMRELGVTIQAADERPNDGSAP
jgi:hypothetical protein